MSIECKIIKSILKKMKIDFTNKIASARAVKKLQRALDKGMALPTDLTNPEIGALEELGIEIPEPVQEEAANPQEGKKRKTGALAYFKELMTEAKKPVLRGEIINKVATKFNCYDYSVGNYVAMAKKDASVLGFLLIEEKDDDGNKILKRAKK